MLKTVRGALMLMQCWAAPVDDAPILRLGRMQALHIPENCMAAVHSPMQLPV